jgi:hypothetical protein
MLTRILATIQAFEVGHNALPLGFDDKRTTGTSSCTKLFFDALPADTEAAAQCAQAYAHLPMRKNCVSPGHLERQRRTTNREGAQ